MKKISVLFAILMIAVVSLFAQAPQKFSYQAVLRDAGNNLVVSQAVGIRISIMQGSVNGSVVYMETQTAVTNANGLVTLQIGGGNVLSGDMSTIDWANGPFFLKTEADPMGGANYTIEGTQQLLSVPYALYAGNSINGFSGDYNDLINTPDIPTVPTKVSAFNNDAQYITQAALGSTLQGYATVGSIPTVPTDVSAFNNDAGYITAADVQQAAEVPTNVSAFVNDAGYITMDSVPSIPTVVSVFSNDANYVTQSVMNVTLSNYATLNSLPTIPANVSSFTNDAGYITAAQVPAQVPADWSATTGPSRILNKPSIPTVPTNVSSFTNDAYYITSNQLHLLLDSIQNLYNSKIDSLNGVIASIGNPSNIQCGSYVVSDFDGNMYTTVPIGSQCWLKQNLRTTRYSDGEPITAGGVGTGNWTYSTTIAYWYYPNDQNVASHIDGYMYNIKAVLHNDSYVTSSSIGVQGPCPNGWHVPSESEWNTLVDYVLNDNLLQCSGAAKALSSTVGWTSTGSWCSPSSTSFPEIANRTGFSALPCGYLKPTSSGSSWGFLEYGEAVYFWTAPSSTSPRLFQIRYDYPQTFITNAGMSSYYAFPVRCLRD